MEFFKNAILVASVATAQMTMSGMGSSSLSGSGSYAASYPSTTQYSSQNYGQPLSSSAMGAFSMQQGSTQMNAQPQYPTQSYSVPTGYSAPQYSSYGAATQPYLASSQSFAPSSNFQPYSTSQTAPQSNSVRSASLGTSSMGPSTYGSSANYGAMGSNYGSAMGSMGMPTQYSAQYPSYSQNSQPSQYSAQPSQYSAQPTQYSAQPQYPTPYQSAQQQYTNYGMGMGMGSSSQPSSGAQTTTQQVGVRTMYVPMNQVQQILSQYPGAHMVGTVTANQIPAGASVY